VQPIVDAGFTVSGASPGFSRAADFLLDKALYHATIPLVLMAFGSGSFFNLLPRRESASVDLHHNIFYSYRGPNIDGADRDRQLENNLTKALINTLCLGGEAVWRPFLAEFGLADAPSAAFLLQRRDLPSGRAANKRHRVLLGISKRKSVWSPDARAETTYESVPDAWVYGDGFAVLVESKVNDADFSPGQMQGHLARLQSSEPTPPKIALKTWG
jgi:hypothetical protein